jgi:hypothetical protein
MANRRKILVLFLAVAAMIGLASSARHWFEGRSDSAKNNVIFADDYRLNGVYRDSLAVVAAAAALEADSHVKGDAALLGDQLARVDGAVDGNLTMAGESLTLGADGSVNGDLSAMGTVITIGGQVDGRLTVVGDELVIEPDARLNGEIVACVNTIDDQRADVPTIKPCQDVTALLSIFRPLQLLSESGAAPVWAAPGGLSSSNLAVSLSASLLFTGLSALAVMVFPRQFSRMQEAISTTPRRLASLGCMALLLTLGLGTGAVGLMTVARPLGLVLVPLGLLLSLGLAILLVMGWITLALLLGDVALRHMTRTAQPPVIDAAFGSLLLFALWHVLAIVPFGGVVGLLLMGVLGAAGLGGALATRLGTRPLRRQYFVQG